MYAWLRQAVLTRRLREAVRAVAARDELVSASARSALGRALQATSALRSRSLRTVERLSAGESPGPEISVDKVLLGTAEQATFDALRRLHWAGMSTGDTTSDEQLREEWFYSRASTIFGGAVDIQRDIIADRVLGLPRAAVR
jgi:alkylation response protein AidB-like acyl-CoA dehydrogenase